MSVSSSHLRLLRRPAVGSHSWVRTNQEAIALATLLAFAGVFLVLIGHGLNFRHDDWDIIEYRDTSGMKSILEPLNGHFSLVPIVVFRILLGLVGLNHYFWFRLVLVLYNVLCGFLIWRLLRRRVPAELAIAGTALVVLCGPLYENYLFAVQIGQVGSLLGGLVAWNLLDDTDRSHPILLLIALAFSLASSAIGLAVLVGVGVEVGLRRDTVSFVAIVGAGVLFLVWYFGYGQGSGAIGLHDFVSFVSGLIAYTLVGTCGLWPAFHLTQSELRATAFIVLVIPVVFGRVALRRGLIGERRPPAAAQSPWPRVANLAVLACVYWALTSVARGDASPYRSRYIHPGAIVIVLLIGEFLAYRAVPKRARAAVGAFVAVIVLFNLPFLYHNASKYRQASNLLTAQITALQVARDDAPRRFEPSPGADPQVRAALFFAAERRLDSSPTFAARALLHAPESLRAGADEVLIRMSLDLPVSGLRCGAKPVKPLTSRTGVAGGAGIEIINLSRSPVPVLLRRLASTPTTLPHEVPSHGSTELRLERDGLGPPWYVTVPPGVDVMQCSPATRSI